MTQEDEAEGANVSTEDDVTVNKDEICVEVVQKRVCRRNPWGRPTKLPSCSLPTNMQPTYYIGNGNGSAIVEAYLLGLGWKRIVDKFNETFKLKWVECKSTINYTAFREGEQLVNHIPNSQLLTNKLGLLNTLQEYERVTMVTKGRPPRLRMVDFVPETYRLDERNDRELFLQLYKEGEMWICKPTGMNQGKGIFLIRSREDIYSTFEDRDNKQQQNRTTKTMMTRIIQRYIRNPLLLDERKFDIRAYMLIASTVPFLVLYHKGYVRLSCNKYNGEDQNLSTHLTNQYIQKKDPTYKDFKEDSVWSMDSFNQYINEKVAAGRNLEQNWVYNSLTRQMQRIMLHCFNSVKHRLQCKTGFFDLYGLDFMVDLDMKVSLIEVNSNPSLSTSCESLKDIIPAMIEETLGICLECFDKSRRHQMLTPISAMKNFSVLLSVARANAIPARGLRSVSPSKTDQSEATKSNSKPSPSNNPASPKPARKQGSPPQICSQFSPPVARRILQSRQIYRSSTFTTPLITRENMQTTAKSMALVSPYSISLSLPDDIKFKMTHASAMKKAGKSKTDRGN